MRFNPDLHELISPEQLDADFGGEHQYEFEPNSYWDQIVAACGIAPDGTRVEGEAKEELPMSDTGEKDEKTPSSTTPSTSSSETALEEKHEDASIPKEVPAVYLEQPSFVAVS
ncbi:hypothetical protein C0995_006724 [Termitomyces sp. Mi166|nr:hypothetical protein C0995_006724 [Termitomyces sp. Mi166\